MFIGLNGQNCKFVPADTGDNVTVSCGGGQRTGRLDQHRIANGVPLLIVDLFEVIQID